MSKHRHTVVPRTLCFVFHQDELLLIKANASKDWEGFYNALGGHIEKGEDIIDNAVREIKEESGLDVTETKLKGIVHASNFFGKDIMMFVTTSKASTKTLDEIETREGNLEWVRVSELDKLKIFDDIKPILSKILKNDSDEVFTAASEFDGKDGLLKISFS
ncbi:MAG: NUDIX domain-containing protein [Candidatus Woesebacteria bacterium]|jgi:8-oxo-dGTP diphosphatase